MRRCSVPFWRSTMSAMPAVMRLKRMKFTIMPGELRTKPLGVWLAAAPASTTFVLAAGEASAAATTGRACAASSAVTPASAPAGMLRVAQTASAAARDASSTVTWSPASVRTSLAAVDAPLEPCVETIVSCGLLAVGDRRAVALRDEQPGGGACRRPSTSRTSLALLGDDA